MWRSYADFEAWTKSEEAYARYINETQGRRNGSGRVRIIGLPKLVE